MTLDWETARTGIFRRLGRVFGAVSRMETFQSDIIDASGTSVQEAVNEYISATDAVTNAAVVEYVDRLIKDQHAIRNEIGASFFRRCKMVAEKTLIEMVQADMQAETPPTGLPHKTVLHALYELREQMIGASQTLDHSTITVGSVAAGGSNVGNGTILVSVEPDNSFHSSISQFPTTRTETLSFTCVEDARSKRVVRGSEIFEVRGADKYGWDDHRWPGGSGYVGKYGCASPQNSDGRRPGRNILRNSSFENFEAHDPKSWNILTGSAGTHILQDKSVTALGTSALKMASNGSTTITIQQEMGNISTGTPVGVETDALYGLALLARKSGSISSAGSLSIGLANASGSMTSGNFLALAHGDISASAFGIHTTTFRASLTMPDPLYFTIRQGTAFTSGTNVHIDGVVLSRMYPTAPGGVHFLCVPGTTAFNVNDTFTVALTNGGQGAVYQYMDRFFDLYNKGIFPPGASTGTITDGDAIA